MKKLIFILLAVTTLSAAAQEVRTWTSASGTTIEAAYIASRFGEVILQPPGDDKVRIRLDQLSEADQLIVQEIERAASGEATLLQKANPELIDLFGSRLVNAKGKSYSTAELNGKIIGICFSASWSPPCRAFTTTLLDIYSALQAAGKPFEVVLVSSDRDKTAAKAFMKRYDMPWLAVPFKDKHREALKLRFGIQGIPTLVIIDDQGNTLSSNARGEVMQNGAAAFDEW